MAKITLKGNPVTTAGELPKIGEKAKDFVLVDAQLTEKRLSDFRGPRIVLNIFPSIDTAVCATSVKNFNEKVTSLENTLVINISKDLPFALDRFCASEGLKNVISLSDFRGDFSDNYHVKMEQGPLKGLFSRVVIVLDEEGTVLYTEQVPEITQEPDYKAALEVLK